MTKKEQTVTENLIKGMSVEEIDVVLGCIPDSFLLDELSKRLLTRNNTLEEIRVLIGES